LKAHLAQLAFKVHVPALAGDWVNHNPLSLMIRAGIPQSATAWANASQAALAVGPSATRAATRTREWSLSRSMIHAFRPSASAQQVASICQASLGRGQRNRRHDDRGRLRG
jgi:hypothetical protein